MGLIFGKIWYKNGSTFPSLSGTSLPKSYLSSPPGHDICQTGTCVYQYTSMKI